MAPGAAISIKPYFGGVTVPAVARPRVSAANTALGGLANALGQAAEVTDGLAEEEAVREAGDATIKAVQDFDQFRRSLQNDDDWKDYESKAANWWTDWRSANLSGLGRRGRNMATEQIASIQARALLEMRDDADRKRRDLSRGDFYTRYSEGLASLASDPTGPVARDQLKLTFGLLDLKQEAGDFTAEEVAKLKTAASEEMGRAYVQGWIAKSPGQALAILNDPAADGMTRGLGPDAVRVLKAEAQRELQARNAAALVEQQRQQQLAAMDLEIKVSRGQAGEVEVFEALQRGIISPSAAADLVIRSDKVTKEREAEGAQRQRVADALHGTGAPLSPASAEDRKAVDLAFGDFSAGLQGIQDEDERASMTVAWVSAAGILPAQLDNAMRAGARGAPAEVLAAADLYGRLRDGAPMVAAALEGSDYTFLGAVQHYVETGVPGGRAVELARGDVLDAKAPERVERRDRWTDNNGKMETETRTWLSAQLDDGSLIFGGATALPDGLVGEFVEKARSYYLETGNLDAARKMALRDVQATWGKSSVGGEPRWMQYPPERIYGSGTEADAEWMTRQLMDDINVYRLGNLGSGEGLPEDASDFNLVPAPSAGRQEAPGYFVQYVRPDGVLELLTDPKTGRPLLWRPDWTKSREPGERQRELEEAEAEARKRREQVETLQNAPTWEEIGRD